MSNTQNLVLVGAIIGVSGLAAVSAQPERPARPSDQPATRPADRQPERPAQGRIGREAFDRAIEDWPAGPQEAARKMMEKYGPPTGVTESVVFWKDNAPWKYTKVYAEEVDHAWPVAHTDFVEQGIAYRVPPEATCDLAAFDGSVLVDRTKGCLSARCDKEEMNFLALNIAHEVVTGKRSVEDARAQFAKVAMAFKKGEKDPATQGFQFRVPTGDQGDPDKPQMGMTETPDRGR